MMTTASNKQWGLLVFTSIACLIALTFGALFIPGEWYQELNRAPWNPPDFVFGLVWPILYIMIALSGWLIFRLGDTRAKAFWLTQLFLNALWSWIFFGQHWVLIALIDIIVLDIMVLFLVVYCWHKIRAASLLLIPYLMWLTLATTLNAYILLMN